MQNLHPNPLHMPLAMRNPPPLSGEIQHTGEAGVGGTGLGPSFSSAPVSIDPSSRNQIPQLETDKFCEEYHLGDDMRKLFDEHGFDTINSLFVVNESQLKELGFKVGHIAELRWAVKKMLLVSGIPIANTAGEHTPILYGGQGGAGGDSRQKAGHGGIGKAPVVGTEDVWRFSVIGGGIGGTGGDLVTSFVEHRETVQMALNGLAPDGLGGTAPGGPLLQGGQGGSGGRSHDLGAAGGLGEAPQISITDVAFFWKITGGIGGAGGASEVEGGGGGTGEGSAFPKILAPLDDETRRRVPYTSLENFDIKAERRQVLQEYGFQSVGGLFEASDTDLPPSFKLGHVAGLKVALDRFAATAWESKP
ncbi:hypothetical protein K438DRAFT_1835518 [Mycena galopus ATCC 62051]|nr:hypothetical protein K438DRAFT_1835518 [Mycena galopus ATCC 62051]